MGEYFDETSFDPNNNLFIQSINNFIINYFIS